MQWAWGLACIPLIPLLATPVPNLPLYYAGYKVRSSLSTLAWAAKCVKMQLCDACIQSFHKQSQRVVYKDCYLLQDTVDGCISVLSP